MPAVIDKKSLNALVEQFRELPAEVTQPVFRAAASGGRLWQTTARALAPRSDLDKVHLQDALQYSVKFKDGDAKRGARVQLYLFVNGRMLEAGGYSALYQRYVEFGTRNMAAQPYFYAAYYVTRRKIYRRIDSAARRGLRKLVRGKT